MEPTLQAPLQHCPPAFLLHCRLLPMGCSFSLGLLLWVLSTGCPSFKLHSLLHCVFLHECMWRSAPSGAYGLQGTACSIIASTGLQETTVSCLEHLLPSCTDLGPLSFISLFSYSSLPAAVA